VIKANAKVIDGENKQLVCQTLESETSGSRAIRINQNKIYGEKIRTVNGASASHNSEENHSPNIGGIVIEGQRIA
jgi:hypothetical protein